MRPVGASPAEKGAQAGPWTTSRVPLRALAVAAILSGALWHASEIVVRAWPHPQHASLVVAAERARAAQQEIAHRKEAGSLLQPDAIDPNRTGLIGPDWSEITTTIGDLPAKRTVTNPDLAAAIARWVLAQRLQPGAAVGLVLSGSFVGANVAAVVAVEALGLRPIVVTSLGASMYGATDPDLTWLDMEAALAQAGVLQSRSIGVVLGGESALGGSLSAAGRDLLRQAAQRNGYQPLEAPEFAGVKQRVHEALAQAAPDGLAALISAGGSVLAMGTCLDAYQLPSGSVQGRLSCRDGIPGLIHDLAHQGRPVLHLLNIKRLALDWGLPYDPMPLPSPGENALIYSRMAFQYTAEGLQ
jgi:poly-gamma-glutamate system protein